MSGCCDPRCQLPESVQEKSPILSPTNRLVTLFTKPLDVPQREKSCTEVVLDGDFELLRHARRDLEDAADGVAGIVRREGAVEEVDALDLFGRDEAPTRRADRIVVADQRGEQEVVGINKTRAEEAMPQVRVCRTACVSPLLRLRTKRLGIYLTASSVSMMLIVRSICLRVTLATVLGSCQRWTKAGLPSGKVGDQIEVGEDLGAGATSS